MKKELKPAERLIVAADFKPSLGNGRKWVRDQVLSLANTLHGTGVTLKVNSALRACGYDLIDEIKERGLKVFADLKLYDIGETLSTDAALLREFKPDFLTVSCVVGTKALMTLKTELPDTELLGVTVLTSISDAEAELIHRTPVNAAVMMLAKLAATANLGGLISAPAEATALREFVGTSMTINTPGIRPGWSIVKGDDQNQNRVMTPADAIKAGADRIVVGRPIVNDKSPYDAVMRTIDEIASAASAN